jgi:hypothetical protein
VVTSEADPVLDVFRRALVDVLTQDAGSTEVENLYLARYRRSLKSQVQASTQPLVPMASVESIGMPLGRAHGPVSNNSGKAGRRQ